MENQLGKIEYPRDRAVFYVMHCPGSLQGIMYEILTTMRKAESHGMPMAGCYKALMDAINEYNEEWAYYWSDGSKTIEDEMWEAKIYG